jgi:hypothetical protein
MGSSESEWSEATKYCVVVTVQFGFRPEAFAVRDHGRKIRGTPEKVWGCLWQELKPTVRHAL